MDIDETTGSLAVLPRFTSPSPPPASPSPNGSPEMDTSPSTAAGPVGSAVGGSTRTAISSPASGKAADKSDLKVTVELAIGLLGVGFAIAAWAVRTRYLRKRRLREPTRTHLKDIAEPLAAIGARHLPTEMLNQDLADAAQLAAAIGRYLGDGPVIEYDRPDPNLIPATTDEETAL